VNGPLGQTAPTAEADGHGRHRPTPVAAGVTVAYVMSRFPKLSETFVMNEILAVERQGAVVEVYPLLRERVDMIHDAARPLVERAHYFPFLSWPIAKSQAYWLRRRPGAYLGALGSLVRGTAGSLNFFLGAVGIFPKVAHAARLMEADGVTHVHCHFANHPASAGFVIHRLTEIPYSFTAHGSDIHVERRMLRQKVAESAFTVAISRFNQHVIEDECGPSSLGKVVVVHCGVGTERFRPRSHRDAAGPFTVVCVGTLHEVKGQSILVEACRRLAAEGLEFRCVLAGDGPDRAKLERQVAAAGLENQVELAGSLTQDRVTDLIRSADALVAPSVPTAEGKREGLPVVLMEALACGVPAVASDLSGIPELVGDGVTGLLVQPGDAAGLAAALRRLADDPELAVRLGRAGREKVEREFDLDTNAALLARRFTREPQ
jgi:glycosyltransferase involved in cell wall biosynthesis